MVLLLSILSHGVLYSQYILNGSAQKNSCNCYTLTPATAIQSGSVWNSNKINLKTSFDFWFNVNLGCLDADGADGIVFILQPISTSVGSTGEGMGFAGVAPSIGIALDTWQNLNLNDPAYDHISIQANGNINHLNDLAGPVPISATSDNVEDCQWHQLRITWDVSTHWLRSYFDGVLRVEKQIDLTATIFNGDPNVYWGFTGATGGAYNLQQFCTALDPIINLNAVNNVACKDSVVQFTNSSVSFAPIVNFMWSFGDGSTSTQPNPPAHAYASAGTYSVGLKITGLDGCEKDTVKTITIASAPQAFFTIGDTCFFKTPQLTYDTNSFGINYQWRLDGSVSPLNQTPLFTLLPAGPHTLELMTNSLYNCGPQANKIASFVIKPVPQIQAQANDACVKDEIFFKGEQLDNNTTIIQWQWDFGDHQTAVTSSAQHQYSQKGNYTASLWAKADNGCYSDTILQPVKINAAYALAGADTTVVKDYPFQLHGDGNGSFLWSPSTGLSDAAIKNPIVTLSVDEVKYILTVTTAEGCIAADTVLIKTMKGPAIYVPSAFTPNSDGNNDVFHPVYVGIKELKQFAIFNRWGQMLFTTNEMRKGWEAKNGVSGTYVWFIKAVDNLGQPVLLKGTVTIIR
ncbi:MAG: PKD domain-containing protein [Bacteroidota bacterium]|nr:PKD domain-containing protein [Bacteroidota bacterium]